MNSRILPSILSADFSKLGIEAQAAIDAGADGIHFDVMDNHYVPNLSLGPMGCQALRDHGFKAFIDVHLMTKPVDALIQAFAKAGANSINIHHDATDNVDKSLDLIHSFNCCAGLALNPEDEVEILVPFLNKIDQVLVMSVQPGFGGQTFISSVLKKIKTLKTNYPSLSIVVDGGIKIHNIQAVAKAGADSFVVGSAFFKSDDYSHTLQQLRKEIQAG